MLATAAARVVRRQQLAGMLSRRGFAVQGKHAVPQQGVKAKPFVYQDLFQAVNCVDVPYTKIGGSECVWCVVHAPLHLSAPVLFAFDSRSPQ
jgi:hypothetical protein